MCMFSVVIGPYRLVNIVLGIIKNPRQDVLVGKGNVTITVEIHGGQQILAPEYLFVG